MKSKLYAAITITVVLWASSYVGIRAALQHYQPVHIAVFRYVFASIILIPFALVKRVHLPKLRELPLLFLMGFVGFTFYNFILNTGQKLVTAASASFIINTCTMFSVILAAAFLKEKIKTATIIGIIVSLSGICLISFGENMHGIILNSGALLILLAALSCSVYFILQKSLLKSYSSFEATCYAIWSGTLLMLPAGGGLPGAILKSSIVSTLSIVYLGIFPAVIAYFCWAYVLSKLDVSKASVFLFFIPVVTLLMGFLLIKEVPPVVSVIGGAITVLGVIISSKFSGAASGRRV